MVLSLNEEERRLKYMWGCPGIEGHLHELEDVTMDQGSQDSENIKSDQGSTSGKGHNRFD